MLGFVITVLRGVVSVLIDLSITFIVGMMIGFSFGSWHGFNKKKVMLDE